MSFVKRALIDIAKAGVPRFRGGIFEVIDDVYEGNRNVRFIRETLTADTVNELAHRRAGEVEEAMFVGRVAKRVHALHKRKVRNSP